ALGIGGGAERSAVIVERAQIPAAVPGRAFERGFQRAEVQAPGLGAAALTPSLGDGGETGEDGMQEPAEPHTFAPAQAPDMIEAVIPIAAADEGQGVTTDAEAAVEGAGAMLEDGGVLGGGRGLEIGLGLIGCKESATEKRNHLVEQGVIAGDLQVVREGIGEPERVVGDAGANAAAGGRMPPVLDVAGGE